MSKPKFSINEISFFIYRILIGGIPGFFVPRMMAFIGTDTRQKWLAIFAIAAVVIFVCFIFFTFAIDDNEEKYDEEIHHDPNVDDIASAIEDVVTDGENPLDPEILVDEIAEIIIVGEKRPESIASESGNSYTTCSSKS